MADTDIYISRNDLLRQVRDAKLDMYRKSDGVFPTEERGALLALSVMERMLLDWT